MKRFQKKAALLIAAGLLPMIAEANPGLSRQMNMACMACHNQNMSQLNAFGRSFAASGMTMVGENTSKSMINGNTLDLGLPSVLNASVLLKARYVKRELEFDNHPEYEEVGRDRGSFEMYKASKLFFGGKVAENVGAMANYMYDSFGARVVYAEEFGSGYAGLSFYMQDDFGPFSGMEYYNTGLYAPLKMFENSTATNAPQATRLGHGPATGIQAYYGGEGLFAAAGLYVPATSEHEGLDIGSTAIRIGRVGYQAQLGDFIPALEGWSVMLGGYAINGTAALSNAALEDTKPEEGDIILEISRKAYGIDMQIEGEIAGMNTLIVLNNVLKNQTKLFNTSTQSYVLDFADEFTDGEDYKAGDNRAISAEIQVNPLRALGVKVAYLHYNDVFSYDLSVTERNPGRVDKADRDDYTIGVDYNFRQNVRVAYEYTYSKADNADMPDSDNYFIYAMIGF